MISIVASGWLYHFLFKMAQALTGSRKLQPATTIFVQLQLENYIISFLAGFSPAFYNPKNSGLVMGKSTFI